MLDGRLIAGILTLGFPAILIAATVAFFGSNPLSILVLLITMLLGTLYLLSYPDLLASHTSA